MSRGRHLTWPSIYSSHCVGLTPSRIFHKENKAHSLLLSSFKALTVPELEPTTSHTTKQRGGYLKPHLQSQKPIFILFETMIPAPSTVYILIFGF